MGTVLLTEQERNERISKSFPAIICFVAPGFNLNERPDPDGIHQHNRQAQFSGFIFFTVIGFSAFLRFSCFLANKHSPRPVF